MVNGRLLSRLRYINDGYDIEALSNKVNYLFELQRHGCYVISDEEYDRYKNILLELGYNVPHKVVYEESREGLSDIYLKINLLTHKKLVKRFKDLVNIEELEDVKVLAFVKVYGYDIRVVYNKGKLVSAVTYGSNGLGMDIKEHIEHIVKPYDSNLEQLGVVEFRCKLTIEDIDIEDENDLKDLVEFNRNRLKLYVLDIICNNIKFTNLIEKINVIKDLGYSLPNYMYKKCDRVDSDLIDTIIKQLGSSKTIEVSLYSKNDYINKVLEFEFNARTWESKNITGVVESVRFKRSIHGLEPLVDIVYFDNEERCTLSNISLYDIGVMIDNGYIINNDIYFKLYRDGSIELLSTKGELLL